MATFRTRTAFETSEDSQEGPSHLLRDFGQDGTAKLRPSKNALSFGPLDKLKPSTERSDSSEAASTTSSARSEYDYDAVRLDPPAVVQGSSGGGLQTKATLETTPHSQVNLIKSGNKHGDVLKINTQLPAGSTYGHHNRRRSIPIKLQKTGTKGKYLLSADDPEIKEILRRGIERQLEVQSKNRRSRSK